MEVILQEDVAHLGHIGEIVKVRDGYARNYLFPRGLAVLADKRNLRELEHQKRVVEEKRQRVAATAQEVAKKMAAVDLQFAARAGDGGKLFGSITNQDIEKQLRDKGFDVERRRIKLDEPIKSVGAHKVVVTLAAGVPCEITVEVVALDEPKSEETAPATTAASEAGDAAARSGESAAEDEAGEADA